MTREHGLMLTRTLIIAIVTAFSVHQAIGQTVSVDSIPRVERQLWKVNIVLPGVEYERALGNFATININPYVDLGYSSNFVLGDAWLLQPALDVQVRRYYNLFRRVAKQKRTLGNSGSFFSLSLLGVGRSVVDTDNFRNVYYYGLGPLWGIQRTYRSNFNISFQAGVAYITNGFGQEDFLVRLKLRIGLALKRLR